MAYKKRRIAKSINKNAEKSLRHQNNLSPLKAYFPQIKRLMLDIQFLSKEGHVLEERHLKVDPDDFVTFTLDCPGGCGDGKVSLEGKIEEAVQQRMPITEGRALCANPLYSDDKLCGSELKCGIRVEYFPESKEEPKPNASEN